MLHKHHHEIPTITLPDGQGVSRQVLISSDEAPHFAMRCFTIQPGGSMPRHSNLVEHEQYVLSGSAEVGIGEEIITVIPGDVIYIPAGSPHWYKNTGNEAFEFLCLVPNGEDKMWLL